MSALFEADGTFVITGRGLVASGRILEGEISKGMLVSVPGWKETLAIDSIEFIRNVAHPEFNVGLLFLTNDTSLQLRWRALNLRKAVLKIHDKKGEPGATDNPDDAQRLREDH